MIELVIASISSTGRPPNFDFLMIFWPVENCRFFFLRKKIKKTKFCEVIENVIASILSTGRPLNSDFLINFWPVENCRFPPPSPKKYQKNKIIRFN